MKVASIQNKAVLDTLLSGNIYKADINRVSKNLIEPYNHMQKLYGWSTCPIFAAPVGYRVEFFGCRVGGGVLIYLDVPDEFIRFQPYYSWTDFIFYIENPDEEVPDASVIEYNISKPVNYEAIQVTMPFIKPEWISCYMKCIPKRFLETHDGSGGRNVLLNIDYYTNESDKIFTNACTHVFN